LRRHLRGQARQRVEDRCQSELVGAPGAGHGELVGLALEQRDAEPVLEQVHHAADRSRRHVQLGRRGGEAAVPRRRLERPDAIKKRELAHLYHQEN
jgi:hypothetical protein